MQKREGLRCNPLSFLCKFTNKLGKNLLKKIVLNKLTKVVRRDKFSLTLNLEQI